MTIDFNRAYLSDRPLNRTINELVEQTEFARRTATISRSQLYWRRLSQEDPIHLAVRPEISQHQERYFRAWGLLRGKDAPASDRRRIQIRYLLNPNASNSKLSAVSSADTPMGLSKPDRTFQS